MSDNTGSIELVTAIGVKKQIENTLRIMDIQYEALSSFVDLEGVVPMHPLYMEFMKEQIKINAHVIEVIKLNAAIIIEKLDKEIQGG